MTTLTHLNLPDRQESELAQRGQRELAAYLSTRLETQRIAIVGEDDKAHTIELPTSALTLLMEILGELASGNAVQIVPVHAELTTQEAANILNVSRPHMVKLLEARKLPFHKCQQRVKSDPLTVTTNGLILIHLVYSGLASAITPAFRFCFSR